MDKKKLIIIGSILLTLILVIFCYFAYLEWITTTVLLIIIGAIVILAGIIFVVNNIISGMQVKTDVERKIKKLNSNLYISWSRDLIKNKFCDDLSVEEYSTYNIGKEGKQTPIGYIKGYGKVCCQNYNIFVDLFDPEGNNTIKVGHLSQDEVLKYCEALAFAPVITEKRIIRRRNTDGSVTEEQQESVIEDEKVEETEEE